MQESGSWRQVLVAGKRVDLYEPTPPVQPGAVLFLHGHARTTLVENRVYTAELERLGLRAACPHGERSWWGDRICREFDPEITPAAYLREQLLPYLAEVWDVRPPLVALLGVSMGGQGALRLAYRHALEFPIVAALAPQIDFYHWYGLGLPLDEMYPDAEAARQDTATLHIHPLNWPRHQLLTCDPTDYDWFDGVERLMSKLSSTGIPYESDLTTSRGGHSWDYFNAIAPKVMHFLRERLDQESRRV